MQRATELLLRRTPPGLQRLLAGGGAPALEVVWPSAYAWPPAATWLEPLRRGLARIAAVRRAPLASPAPGVYPAEVRWPGGVARIAIDIADRPDVDLAVAAPFDVYFKMQYARGGYGDDHIIPGGFVPASDALYRYLPYLRALRDRRRFGRDVAARFGLEFAAELRREAVRRLRAARGIDYGGGEKLRYFRALREVATSRVCVDLPGNGPLCFRLVDYMAVGACIIAYPHEAVLPVPLRDGVHVVYMREDLSDLVELCRYFASHEEARERLCLASRRYFDEHLSRERLAGHYLETVLARVAGERPPEARQGSPAPIARSVPAPR